MPKSKIESKVSGEPESLAIYVRPGDVFTCFLCGEGKIDFDPALEPWQLDDINKTAELNGGEAEFLCDGCAAKMSHDGTGKISSRCEH